MDYVYFHGIITWCSSLSTPHQLNSHPVNPTTTNATALIENIAMRIRRYYLQATPSPIHYKNIAAKPPATAAKLKVVVAPAALETVAGLQVVEVLVELVLLPEAVAVEVPIVALPGSPIVLLYNAQVEFGERGQVLSTQML
jgi:hypothetical protein